MADFQKRYLPDSKVYISVPTWANHHNIWRDAGVEQTTYRYYKPETRGLDFEGMMEDIKVRPSFPPVPLKTYLQTPEMC
jgi:aspartate aminotransferase